ncbi:MAG: alpha-L-fucosidase [Rikenellaceae bacterium]
MRRDLLKFVVAIGASIAIAGCCTAPTTQCTEPDYTPDWRSLSRHQTPEWLMDAKFGIYSHWGHQSYMYSNPECTDVMEAFEKWTGEKFNAAAWAELYKNSGAQFAGPIAQHGSGCLNWDSEITDWNSVNHGPKVDILGELSREIRKRGMKVMASFHSITYGSTWGQISLEDRTYLDPMDDTGDVYNREDTRWLQGWVDKMNEATTKYDLDLIWFDTSFGRTVGGELRGYVQGGKFLPDFKPTQANTVVGVGGVKEETQQQVIANYFNYAKSVGKDVEVVYKGQDMPYNIGMRNIEDGNLDGAQYDPWMTDIDMMRQAPGRWSAWFYHPDSEIKDANMIVDILIDVTSKNGRLLLNVPPMNDGTFSPRLTDELEKIGAWLKVNGEGIYGSTPWAIYGEGPGYVKYPGHHGHTQLRGAEIETFSGEDVRYTSKGKDLYAFALGYPEGGRVRFATLGYNNKLYPNEIKDVQLLGCSSKVNWDFEGDGLYVDIPENMQDEIAYCFKVVR